METEIEKPADLVLSGGGVKGVGLAGAVGGLVDAGYHPQCVSGTSIGAILGAIVAGAGRRGRLTSAQIKEVVLGIDYGKMLDRGRGERVPIVGPAMALMRGNGIFRGDYAHQWVRGQLENLGIRTFGDLATDDVSLPEERRYALVVTVTDLTLGRLVRLPWDYRRVYGRDPDEQSVADAVRASMSIPFFFQPVSLTSAARFTSTLVDGGVVSNFPIDSLDRIDGVKPRWPTFGVTVAHGSPAGGDRKKRSMASFGAGDLLERIVSTMLSGRDESYLEQPWVRARTIQVDSPGIRTFDFSITRSEIEECYAKGHAAAQDFLASWDWHSYCERFRVLP